MSGLKSILLIMIIVVWIQLGRIVWKLYDISIVLNEIAKNISKK